MKKITNPSDTVLIDPNEPLILPDGTALVGRIEWFLYALCCLDYQNLPTPMSRIEEFANALITGEIPNIQPQSRAEQFFLAILDGNVSDLPQPQSRSEVLLDKLARGEFDLSDVEPIQSRYELLLAYLIKNGGIGNIDYVLYEFSEKMKTMYNTIEKPLKSLELSGNTLVNCVLEDTENDDYTSFDKDYSGTSFTINGTSEGAIKSAILSGNTLVNQSTTSELTFKSAWQGQNIEGNTLQSGKKYFVSFNLESDNSELTLQARNGNSFVYHIQKGFTKGKNILSFILEQDANGLRFQVGGDFNVKISNIIILEYQDGMENWDIPYFEGMQSVKMPVLTTIGKNLFDGKLEKGLIDGTTGEPIQNQSYARSVNFIKVQSNISYILSEKNDSTNFRIYEYDENFGYIGFLSTNPFTTTSNTSYIKFRTYPKNSGDDVSSVDFEIMLERGNTVTTYEPYKTNILTVNEDVTLRGIGNVKDELDCLTGKVTERIGEIVLDGTQDMISDGNGVYIQVDDVKRFLDYTGKIACDKLPVMPTYGHLPSVENGISGYTNANAHLGKNWLYVKINNSINKDEVKEWLTQNPVTVQYQRVTESIKTVDLNVVDQNNTKIDKMHVFNEVTHVNASSDELTPTVNISKSVSYPTIIKPNTKYTVDLKRNDKPLTVNLGGTEVTFASGETRKTITTPNTLTNDKLSYYGVGAKCNEIMLIEGEVERNVDYFTGMQSVVMQNQMPILSTVGKNLLTELVLGDINSSSGLFVGGTTWKSTDFINVDNMNNIVFHSSIPFNIANFVFFKYDKNKNYLGYNGIYNSFDTASISLENNVKYVRFRVPSDVPTGANLQLEQGTVVTTYEPHKTSILSCNEDVTLRGIGDVQDTLDLLTGEVVERIGEVVLDGSEDENWVSLGLSGTGNSIGFYISINNKKSVVVKCDKLPLTNYDDIAGIKQGGSKSVLQIRMTTEYLTSLDLNSFKIWLAQNPLTIQYQLATESIKTADLNVVDQDGNTIPKVKSHNGTTHLEVTVPKQSLLPNISAEVATDNSKDISSLTTKHQEISEAQLTIQDSIQSQSDEIDKAMMATTEIFESILE